MKHTHETRIILAIIKGKINALNEFIEPLDESDWNRGLIKRRTELEELLEDINKEFDKQ